MDRRWKARLAGELVGALLAHTEEVGDLDETNGRVGGYSRILGGCSGHVCSIPLAEDFDLY
jgi:hypothetical protein